MLITEWYDIRNFFETKTLLIFCFVLLIALASFLCSKSGIINLALEGQLIMGVFGFVLFGWIVKKNFGTDLSFVYLRTFISIIGSFIFVFVITLIFAFLTISLKLNQILVGIAINIIATSIALIFTISITNDIAFRGLHFDTFISSSTYDSFMYKKIFFNSTFHIQLFLPILLLILIVPFVWFFISKTTTGLRINAVGKNKEIVRKIGINPEKYQYISVMSGVFLIVIASWFFAEHEGKFTGSVSGYGYLGLAISILGKGKVWWITLFSFLISVLSFFSVKISSLEPDPSIYLTIDEQDDFRKWYVSLENIFNAFIYLIPIFMLIIYEIIKKLKIFIKTKKKLKNLN